MFLCLAGHLTECGLDTLQSDWPIQFTFIIMDWVFFKDQFSPVNLINGTPKRFSSMF